MRNQEVMVRHFQISYFLFDILDLLSSISNFPILIFNFPLPITQPASGIAAETFPFSF
jgi:hypothetical protein